MNPTSNTNESSLDERVTELYAAGADLCLSLAQNVNGSSRLDYNEPGVDIAEFDATYGVQGHPVLNDPLKASHELMTGYMRSAGELLYTVGALLLIPSELVISPGALARSVAVHSARAYRISDPFISPLERCGLCLYLARSTWLPDPASRRVLAEDIDKWISTYGLSKPKDIAQEERLVASMFEEEVDRLNSSREPGQRRLTILRDDNFYARLSRLVHGDPTTLLSALMTAYERPVVNRIYVLFDILTGLVTGYKAGNRINDVRGGDFERYDEIYYAMVDVVTGFREVRAAAEAMFQIRLHG